VSNTPYAVEMRGVTKAFGSLVANESVSFSVRTGTIFALVGENGAGKSTCMNLLYGLFQPDSGTIHIRGEQRAWRSPREAIRAGLGMVHQHFMLAGPHSGLDNIILGDEPEHKGWSFLPRWARPISRKRAIKDLDDLITKHQIAVNLDQSVDVMPVGVQQRLEILKLLYRNAGILILDEPTAVLTPHENEAFFASLHHLKEQGKTIIIITHKLREVLSHADDLAVLRAGRVVATRPTAGLTEQELAELMVGRAVQLIAEVPPAPALGPVALSCQNLSLSSRGSKPRLNNISFTMRAGEIVGIAGVEGNGQSELLELLADPRFYFGHGEGRHRLTASGNLSVLGHDVRSWSAARLRDQGVSMVPEDRHRQGLLLDQDLTQNFLLGLAQEPQFNHFGWIRAKAATRAVTDAITEFDIRPKTPSALAKGLSGGNQQKLVIARELARQPKLLICAQPTRGVDVGAIEFIHQRLLEARSRGMAVLLISSSLEEVLALSDRILVMYEGHFIGECERGVDEAHLGRLMGGGS